MLLRTLYAVALLSLSLVVTPQEQTSRPDPIVFVHGNGDSAALWHTTLWRFESNNYPRELLFAIDMVHPASPDVDGLAQENRSSTIDQAAQLAGFVTRILLQTGRDKVVLVGSSRGGNTIRNYIKRGGGHANVSLAILCGTPNHGVFSSKERGLDSEWNGEGRFLSSLNTGSEVYPGVRFATLRSDKNDKYAQPTGEFLGAPGQPTGVDFSGPELDGATNIVLPNLDHREVAFHRLAFEQLYRLVTGDAPEVLDVRPEPLPILDGMVSGYANGSATNLPVAGARVTLFEVDPGTGLRRGAAVHDRTTGSDGRWGPFRARASAYYELVILAQDYPRTHIFRTPFPRSSNYVHLRLAPLDTWSAETPHAGSVVTMTRPRGYLGHGRDTFTIDGAVPDGVNFGVPGTSEVTVTFPAHPARSVLVRLNAESLTVRTVPFADGAVVLAEFHY